MYVENQDRIVRYDVRDELHFIQARKAAEDHTTWMPAVLVAYADGFADVLYLAESEPPVGFPIGRPAWVTEKWGVLALLADRGNVSGVDDLHELADSVFARAGSTELYFMPIKRVAQRADGTDELVYATVIHPDGVERFSIVRRVDAEWAADIMEVVNSCSTWGEVRQIASRELLHVLLERCGYGTIEDYLQLLDIGSRPRDAFDGLMGRIVDVGHAVVPRDDEPFFEDMIVGFADGDFPPAIDFLQGSLMPRNLAENYGHQFETVLNGTYLELRPEGGPPIVAAMEGRGFRCVEDPDLLLAGLRSRR